LLDMGFEVVAYDVQWFGNFLVPNKNLKIIKGSVLDIDKIDLKGIDCIIHLSSIANDPCGDLNPKLTWEVSALATMQLAEKASKQGVERFIYASSGSVYGVKEEEDVTENLSLNPISEYNKTKMVSERVLLSYKKEMNIQIVRPATVCGYSPRMRLDVSVNLLTMQALESKKINVFGGSQVRPNIHIEDIAEVYLHLIQHPEHVGIFNAGFENMSIFDIAKLVQKHLETEIVVSSSNDPRSYRINSDKLLATGYLPKKRVEDAITEMIEKYRSGQLKNEDYFYNLKWMELNALAKEI